MNTSIEPSELFREIREMDNLFLDLVATPDRVEWHWPSFYRLYIEIDKISWQLQSAEKIFHAPLILNETDGWGADVEIANACLSALGQSLLASIGLLWNISRGMSSRIRDARLRSTLQAHLHPKSSWYQTLRTHYHAGLISDNASLERTILVFDRNTLERIDPPLEQFLLWHQVFDLTDENVLAQLLIAAQKTSEVHTQALRAFGHHFVSYCRIEDLLHPSSV